MQDRPEAVELIDAVVGFLEGEIIPTVTEPRLRFRALVAANVLGIVSRELASGDAALSDEWRRLNHLLGMTATEPPERLEKLRDEVRALNRDLCVRVRAGEADDEPFYSLLFSHCEETVVDKLRVANPRYLDRVGEK